MDIARHWRLRGQRYSLKGSICTHCGKRFFAPRPLCDVCNESFTEGAFAIRHKRHAQLPLAYDAAQR